MGTDKEFKSLREFYPYYLTEHKDPTCRVLHFVGTFLIFIVFFWSIATQTWIGFAAIPFIGYGFAWAGHFFFEKNKPATFQYPGYSLASDFKMFFDILLGKQKLIPKKEEAQ